MSGTDTWERVRGEVEPDSCLIWTSTCGESNSCQKERETKRGTERESLSVQFEKRQLTACPLLFLSPVAPAKTCLVLTEVRRAGGVADLEQSYAETMGDAEISQLDLRLLSCLTVW